MATERTINCEDCGYPRTTTRQNTKYCYVCRLLRDAKFVGRMTRDCWICGTTYAPLTVKQGSGEMCGDCDDLHRRTHVAGTCVYCQQDKPNLFNSDVTVCVQCVLDPEQRGKLINDLQRKRDQRVEAVRRQKAEEIRERARMAV